MRLIDARVEGTPKNWRDIPTGIPFTWGDQTEWWVKFNEQKMIKIGSNDGTEYGRDKDFTNYYEAQEITIK